MYNRVGNLGNLRILPIVMSHYKWLRFSLEKEDNDNEKAPLNYHLPPKLYPTDLPFLTLKFFHWCYSSRFTKKQRNFASRGHVDQEEKEENSQGFPLLSISHMGTFLCIDIIDSLLTNQDTFRDAIILDCHHPSSGKNIIILIWGIKSPPHYGIWVEIIPCLVTWVILDPTYLWGYNNPMAPGISAAMCI